ncbi:hypothetical protein G9U52_08060 [Paenibacillus sp. S3N08]|uniref:Uncharacterized protein n=2 Tax=Paenibacillus agricola TaxID=2716264 RepID=A0ABX0J0Q3_9BACL|nr:hypothetical protein [Paenibacillus agricola]
MYTKLLHMNDDWTETAISHQVSDPTSKYFGGIIDPISGIPKANHLGTPAVMAAWTAALVNPDSRYYHDTKLLHALNKAALFMLNRQHADGTISLGSTNFNSPPDTAFVVGGVTQIYQLLQKNEWPAALTTVVQIKLFLERTLPALLSGGCHTPNHRWVITAALAQLYEIFPMPELIARAEEWLAEGMDITEDGEWTERSNGIYNTVSDISLYHTARVLNRPELFEHVRRNLRMMVYLIHPDGEVVTEYSGRQDLGQVLHMSNYFLIYRLMAVKDHDPLFAAMSDYAASFMTRYKEGVNNHPMTGLLLFPSAFDGLDRALLPDRYKKALNMGHPLREHLDMMKALGYPKHIEHSSMHLAFGAPVIRMRELEDSVTLMARTPVFFSLRHGKARLLGVKLATSFTPGVVTFDELTEGADSYKLSLILEKGYYGPIPESLLPNHPNRQQLSPWYLLPQQHRPVTHLQQQALTVDVTQEAAEWKIHVRSDQREDVMMQLTFILGAEGCIQGTDIENIGESRYVLKSGSLTYHTEGSAFEISSGSYEHWLPDIRNDYHPAGCQYVHINLLTPVDRIFTIRLL